MLAIETAMRFPLVALAVFGLLAWSGPSAAQGPEAPRTTKPAEAKAPAKASPSKQPAKKKPSARISAKAKQRTASLPAVPKGYTAMVHGWHAPSGEPLSHTEDGRPLLTLESINSGDRVTLRPERDDGGFSASELERATRVLADRRTGGSFPVDPRLLDLVYRVARHFEAPLVRVVSGYRTPRNGSRSHHGHGRAIDIVVPGASDEDVASFARSLGFAGVGIYPKSGFVHIDTRPKSYFWVDRSGPGRRNRTVGILGQLAAQADAKALARGDEPPLPFTPPSHDCSSIEAAHGEQASDDDDASDLE